MKETIEIKNFGCIEHMVLELDKINVLTGPQAAGKSLTAKLLYFFKNIFTEIRYTGAYEWTPAGFDEFLKEKFLAYFPRDTWNATPFIIRYSFRDLWMEVSNKNRFQIVFSDTLKSYFNLYESLYNDVIERMETEESNPLTANLMLQHQFLRKLRYDYGKPVAFKQVFIPAGRSFFANFQSSIFTMLSYNQSMDPFLIEFGSYYEHAKRFYAKREESRQRKKRPMEIIDRLLEEILQGKYVRVGDKDYLKYRDARQIMLNLASSGQQEALPLALILKRVSWTHFVTNGGTTLYIEEPEAHLYPESQKRIVELMAAVANLSYAPLQFIITTHSPYILSSFNNLLEAGNIKKECPEKACRVNEVVDERIILNCDEMRAYSLENGFCRDIMDAEMALISPTLLDSISNEISIEFGKLLDL